MKEYVERYWNKEIKGKKGFNNLNIANPPPDNLFSVMKIINKVSKYLKGNCLDIGCGDGFVTSKLNEIVPTTGLEPSKTAVMMARKRYPNIKFVKGPAEKIPFKSSSFDCVFSSDVIEHVFDTEMMFKEFNRVLKKGGHLIVTTPELTLLKNLFIALFYWDKYYYPLNPHARFYSKKTLKEIMEMSGFEFVHYDKTDTFAGFIPTGMIMVAKKIRNL